MATAIEQLELIASDVAANAVHVERLLAALDNRPQDWEYRGEMGEDTSGKATCCCGHPIRFLFPVYDTVKGAASRILGSTCINHYASYRPGDAQRMLAKLAEYNAELSEKRKAAKRAAGMAQVQALLAEWEPLAERIAAYWRAKRESGVRVPDSIYWFHFHAPGKLGPYCESRYTRPCDMVNCIRQEIKRARYALDHVSGV